MGALTSKVYSYRSRIWELDKRFTYTKEFEQIFVHVRFNKILRIKSYNTNEWQKDSILNFKKVWRNLPRIKVEYLPNRVLELKQRNIMNVLENLEDSEIIYDSEANIDFLELMRSSRLNCLIQQPTFEPELLFFKGLLILNEALFNIGFVVEIDGKLDAVIPGKGYFNEAIKRVDTTGHLHEVLPCLEIIQMSTQAGLNFITLCNKALNFFALDIE